MAEVVFSRRIKTLNIDRAFCIRNLKDINCNYIVIGSSRAMNCLNTLRLDSLTKLRGYNLGYAGSSFSENYLTLHNFLNNNKTKSVLLCADLFGVINPNVAYGRGFNASLFLPLIKNDTVFNELYSLENKGKVISWRYLPFVKYAEFNNVYSIEKLFFRNYSYKDEFFKSKGFMELEKLHSKDMNFLKENNIEDKYFIDLVSIDYLKKIISLCKEKKVKLIFFSPPIFSKKFNNIIGKEKLTNILVGLSKSNDIPFLNYNSCEISNDSSLMYDFSHLNKNGAIQFSTLIADSVTKYLK